MAAAENQSQWPHLKQRSTSELVATLTSPNGPLRDMAQQRLIQQAEPDAIAPLKQLLRDSELATARLHALATLEGMNQVQVEDLIEALGDVHPDVRRHALRVAESHWHRSTILFEKALRLVDDPEQRVQLQLACGLGQLDDERAVAPLVSLAWQNAQSPFFVDAILSMPTAKAAAVLTGLVGHDHLSADHGALVGELLVLCWRAGELDALANGLESLTAGASQAPTAVWQQTALAHWVASLRQAQQSLADVATRGSARLRDCVERLGPALDQARVTALDSSRSIPERHTAVKVLGQQPQSLAGDVEAAKALLSPQTPGVLQQAAITMLAGVRQPGTARLLLEPWDSYSPDLRRQVVDALLQRPDWTRELLLQLESGEIPLRTLGSAHRQELQRHRFADVRRRAQTLFGQASASDREEVLRRYSAAFDLPGDSERGAAVYRKSCARCHDAQPQQEPFAPDLRELIEQTDEQWLSGILDPDRIVEPKFQQYTVELSDGGTFSGLLVADSQSAIRLVDAQLRTVLVQREQIVAMQSGGSLMPTGLEAEISVEEMADLLAYLRSGR